MTEPADPTTTSETPVTPTATEQTRPDPEAESSNPTDDPDAKEAAKYRRRLRDTEGERDSLAERLTVMQRAEAERLAGTVLADGRDLWLEGVDLAALLDDDGNIDPTKVTEHATLLGQSRPHWRRTTPSAAPAAEVTANGKIDTGPENATTWSQVLTRKPVGKTE